MTTLRTLEANVTAHPIAYAIAAFVLGSILSSVHLLGALLGLLINALNLAWVIVAAAVFIVSVWLICLSFENGSRTG